ncbi:GNAT family acetyltransferase [Fictibacillus macauensis ZFHKF-1]|uniref:GNAT family acetyltransferase n=1 Tax=Fictibacillus macauensis ZFHKF-1 TaxID=1196324 RepID=I8AGU8_9BACL|nr:GNAT family N-acetyltransferase [Fictibacillus macauensis]EIT84639.1 GNAT family acetyltransferase [Fictibacillus macauensis ZFHKF-1]
MNIKIISTTDDAYLDALAVRKQVFVKEQGVDETLEIDDREAESRHFVLYTNTNQPFGAARLRPIEDGGKVERVCIIKEARGLGYGEQLMQAMEEEGRRMHLSSLTLYAQVQAEGFYKKLGYLTLSTEPFLDAGIWHVSMRKTLD